MSETRTDQATGLDAIAGPDGTFAIVAMDQRNTLRRMLTAVERPTDAETIRTKILGAYELADTIDDENERARAMTFILVGAGPTGVELAASIAQMAALTLGAGWAAAVVVVTATGYALLFFESVPIAGMEHMHHHGTSAYSFHLQAMWVAFTVTAGLVGFFVARMRRVG